MAQLMVNRYRPVVQVYSDVLNGHIRGVFYGPLDNQDSNYSKLMTIFYAFKLFGSTFLVGSSKLIIESDSKVALVWVKERRLRPRALWKTCNEIDSLCNVIGDIAFGHTLREANAMADSLAKFGADVVSLLCMAAIYGFTLMLWGSIWFGLVPACSVLMLLRLRLGGTPVLSPKVSCVQVGLYSCNDDAVCLSADILECV